MDPRSLELIHLELDRQLDEAGRAELAGRLVREPGLRAHQEQLLELARLLADDPVPELPGHFHQLLVRRFAPSPRRARSLRVWLALAASGVLAVIALPQLLPVATGPVTILGGTLAPALPTLEVRAIAGGLRLSFEVPPGSPADIVVEFASAPGPSGPLTATIDRPVRPQVAGRRIVLNGVEAGRTTLVVTGPVAVDAVTATLARDANVIQITPRVAGPQVPAGRPPTFGPAPRMSQ